MITETIERLSAQGIHSVLAQFTDLHGVPKGKLVPLALLAEWVHSGAGFAGPSIWGTGLPRMGARSEYFGRVVPESLRPLPWLPLSGPGPWYRGSRKRSTLKSCSGAEAIPCNFSTRC